MPGQSAAAYQPRTDGSASVRTEPDFDQQLGHIARRLRFSVSNLTNADVQLLDEYGRGASSTGEARYRLVTFRRLMAIASRSKRLQDREALAELIRAEILRGVEPSSVEIAFDRECPVTGQADAAQRAFERTPNPITWQKCKDELTKQLAATREALDAVEQWTSGGTE